MKPVSYVFTLIALGASCLLQAQSTPIEVCDLTLRFEDKAEQEFFYGFAAGDKMQFTCTETNGALLESIEIAEFPENVKFKTFETSGVEKKLIDIPRTAVYRFRIASGTKKDRLVRIQIQRLPATDKTRNFITSVKWVERFDTIYQNDNTRFEKKMIKQTRRVLVKIDTAVVSLVDKTERVHSRTNLSESSTSKVRVNLPANSYEPDRSYEVISWAYWLGIGEAAESQYQRGNKLASLAKSASSVVKNFGFLAGPYGALASLAVDGVSYFTVPPNGDNVKYKVFIKEKMLDQGDGTAVFARQATYTQGNLTFELSNDNYIEAVDVRVRVIAVALVKHFKQEEYYEQKEVPVAAKFEVKVAKIPVVQK